MQGTWHLLVTGKDEWWFCVGDAIIIILIFLGAYSHIKQQHRAGSEY